MPKKLQERPAATPEQSGGPEPLPESRAVAMREMELTAEEARELREQIEHPTALPARQPRDLPTGDASLLR